VVVEAVETEAGGKLHVSGHASAGAAVRLYLNESFLGAATADPEGRFAFTIKEGVAPGNYRVRLDDVEPKSGAVRSRAEVSFNAPDTLAVTSSVSTQSDAGKRQDTAASQRQAAADTTPPSAASPSAVVVPKISTTTVSRGDSLWRISRLTYGDGARYAVIYKANRDQIRNPDRIYPGQIFVLPTKER
jgi:nucleoid-associated protein YgaU